MSDEQEKRLLDEAVTEASERAMSLGEALWEAVPSTPETVPSTPVADDAATPAPPAFRSTTHEYEDDGDGGHLLGDPVEPPEGEPAHDEDGRLVPYGLIQSEPLIPGGSMWTVLIKVCDQDGTNARGDSFTLYLPAHGQSEPDLDVGDVIAWTRGADGRPVAVSDYSRLSAGGSGSATPTSSPSATGTTSPSSTGTAESTPSGSASVSGSASPSATPTGTPSATPTDVLEGDIVPVGSIFMWPTNTAPSGYKICNGASLSRATYDDLFAVIGVTYGAGDDPGNTFALPDFKARFPVGVGQQGAGTNFALAASADVENHTHTMTFPCGPNGATDTCGVDCDTEYTSDAASHLPPYLAINFIIKF